MAGKKLETQKLVKLRELDDRKDFIYQRTGLRTSIFFFKFDEYVLLEIGNEKSNRFCPKKWDLMRHKFIAITLDNNETKRFYFFGKKC